VFIYKVCDSRELRLLELICKILGWSGVVAMLFAFVLFPASSALSKWSMTTDRRLSHAKDKRVSLVQETVAAIVREVPNESPSLTSLENHQAERLGKQSQ
jgi:hypothetical protein